MSETSRDSVKASQFVLRHFGWIAICAVLLVAVGGALVVWLPYQREQRVARMIESHGGDVAYQYCGPDWIPQSLKDRLRFLDQIQSVFL